MSDIIVHIGLPKTGTTSLQQDYFSQLDPEKVEYLGVLVPRYEIQKPLFTNFQKVVNEGIDISKVQHEISQLILKGKKVLISEEMITVSTNKNSWNNKLSNLKKILQPFNYKIIVTIRNPVDSVKSYYYELSHRKEFRNNTIEEIYINTDIFQIYEYDKLMLYLTELFSRKNIIVIEFNNIIKNSLESLQIVLGEDLNKVSQLNNRNKREFSNGKAISKKKVFIFATLFNKMGNFGKLLKKILIRLDIYNNLKQFVKLFVINKQIEVDNLTEKELVFIKSKTDSGVHFLKENWNIDL